jgi:hypothetical protein
MQFNGEGIQHIALLCDDIWPASTACAGRRAADDRAPTPTTRCSRSACPATASRSTRTADARHPARRQHRRGRAAPAAADLLQYAARARCSSSSSSARGRRFRRRQFQGLFESIERDQVLPGHPWHPQRRTGAGLAPHHRRRARPRRTHRGAAVARGPRLAQLAAAAGHPAGVQHRARGTHQDLHRGRLRTRVDAACAGHGRDAAPGGRLPPRRRQRAARRLRRRGGARRQRLPDGAVPARQHQRPQRHLRRRAREPRAAAGAGDDGHRRRDRCRPHGPAAVAHHAGQRRRARQRPAGPVRPGDAAAGAAEAGLHPRGRRHHRRPARQRALRLRGAAPALPAGQRFRRLDRQQRLHAPDGAGRHGRRQRRRRGLRQALHRQPRPGGAAAPRRAAGGGCSAPRCTAAAPRAIPTTRRWRADPERRSEPADQAAGHRPFPPMVGWRRCLSWGSFPLCGGPGHAAPAS